jgi:hypothetical protein
MRENKAFSYRYFDAMKSHQIIYKALCLCASVVILLSACATAPATDVPSPVPHTQAPATDAPRPVPNTPASPDPSSTASLTPDTRLSPDDWQDWPVIPLVSARARQVYQRGMAAGNNPRRFSKVGDCQNITSHFLAAFDNPRDYDLGATYQDLQPAIDWFAGSWGRESQAVRSGFNVAAVLATFQADPKACQLSETPLACELRLYKPSIALVSMETWWAGKKADDYEKYLRQIVEYALSQNVLPVLATKADNLEGDNSINRAIAQVAYDYDLPLWNFWRAAQPLPEHGLQADGFHLTHDPARPDDPLLFKRLSDPKAEQVGWPVRNITALEALDAVWRGVK